MKDSIQLAGTRSTPMLKKIASNAVWLFIERSISIGVTVVTGLYFGRYLGPENYGLYSYALGLYVIFATVSKLGINALVVNEVVQSEAKASRILGSVFLMRMAASLAGVLAINIVAVLLMPSAVTRELTLILSLGLVFGPFETIAHWFEAKVYMKPTALLRSLLAVLIGISRLILIFMGASLSRFAWLIPLEALCIAVLLGFVYRRQGLKIENWRPDRAVMAKFIRDGTPLFLSVVSVVTYMKIDRVMLGHLSPSREVGLYAAAVSISEMFYFLPVVLAGPLFPYLIKAGRQGEKFFQKTFQLMCDGFVWMALLIAAAISLSSGLIIAIGYGSEYQPSSQILALHIWASPLVFLEALRVRWFVIRKNTRSHFTTTAIGALTNIALNLVLIPRFHGYGAAAATILSHLMATVLACFFFPSTRTLGFIMLKAVLAPFRLPTTMRNYTDVRSIVDSR